jgi:5'-deoxynucleotidase YfbR-like HD superfamily hydrolase
MPDSELTVISAVSFPTPALITRAGPETRKRFFEFFAVPIRNANTRSAYYRAIQQFLDWVDRAGYQQVEDIEPKYENATSPEAVAVKALDKLETLIQHNQGINPPHSVDYLFNFSYGRKYTEALPLFAEIRRLIDQDTQRRAVERQ